MDDEEFDLANQDMFTNANMSFVDDILMDGHSHVCLHAHTCNQLGPDSTHSHTCIHQHLFMQSEDKVSADDTADSSEKNSKKRPLGNREAVRKYREKKKARTVLLEGEVVRLRAANQELTKKLQGEEVLRDEITRLKLMLVEFRGRIDGEIGPFPYQKSAKPGDIYPNMRTQNLSNAYMINPCNPCNLPCDDQAYCLNRGMEARGGENCMVTGHGFSGCEFDNLQCMDNQNAGLKEFPGCGIKNGVSTVKPSTANKRKGNRAATAS